jgi:hypothetical protein
VSSLLVRVSNHLPCCRGIDVRPVIVVDVVLHARRRLRAVDLRARKWRSQENQRQDENEFDSHLQRGRTAGVGWVLPDDSASTSAQLTFQAVAPTVQLTADPFVVFKRYAVP